jgi:hypothetical protein
LRPVLHGVLNNAQIPKILFITLKPSLLQSWNKVAHFHFAINLNSDQLIVRSTPNGRPYFCLNSKAPKFFDTSYPPKKFVQLLRFGQLFPIEIHMADGEGKLIQIGDLRAARQDDLKREYERILFGRILGCYTIAETTGMKAVEVVDISKSGISFKMDPKGSFYNIGEEVDLRLYFSAKTYLPVRVTVKRVNEVEESEGKFWLYGCTFDTTLQAHKAIESLVDFIAAYSEQAKKEEGHEKLLLF